MTKLYGQRWKIGNSIGAGGQSEVFHAEDMTGNLPGQFALKRIKNPKRLGRFKGEVTALTQLKHPGIIELIDHSAFSENVDSAEKMYLVTRYVDGGNLEKAVEKGPISLERAINIAKEVALALSHAHYNGVFHRDVKPANILFSNVENKIVVADFGICLICEMDRATETEEVVGPWSFMAPELEYGGKLDVTAAVDVYSLGKLIYFMISGGTVIPRERIFENKYYDLLKQSPQLRILGILLGKMICQLEHRLPDMGSVISELDILSKWVDTESSMPLPQPALDGLLRIREKDEEAKRISIERQQEEERKKSINLLFRDSVGEWLDGVLKAPSASITAIAGFRADIAEALVGHSPMTDLSRFGPYSPVIGRQLLVTKTEIKNDRCYALQLSMWRKGTGQHASMFMHGVPIGQRANLPKQELLFKADFVLYEAFDNLKPMAKYDGYPTTRQLFVQRTDKNSQQARKIQSTSDDLAYLFEQSQWPEVIPMLNSVISRGVEVLVQFIESRGRSLG